MNQSFFVNLLAYIDPGSGAIIIQLAIAFILAVGVYFRRFFVAPALLLWGKLRGTPDKHQENDSQSHTEETVD